MVVYRFHNSVDIHMEQSGRVVGVDKLCVIHKLLTSY